MGTINRPNSHFPGCDTAHYGFGIYEQVKLYTNPGTLINAEQLFKACTIDLWSFQFTVVHTEIDLNSTRATMIQRKRKTSRVSLRSRTFCRAQNERTSPLAQETEKFNYANCMITEQVLLYYSSYSRTWLAIYDLHVFVRSHQIH